MAPRHRQWPACESAKSLLKGAHVEVQGRLQSYRYEDNAGVQRRV
jgi:single-stranded DNA-binding protein